MTIKILKQSEPKRESYKDSKEYLDRQQKIDLLLVAAKLIEPSTNPTIAVRQKADEIIIQLLESLK